MPQASESEQAASGLRSGRRKGSDSEAGPDRESPRAAAATADGDDDPASAVEASSRPPGLRLRAFATRELDQALDALGWRGSRIHAGVHLARKNLRRARATLALGGPALGPGAALIDRELRKLNDGLSALRDAHALVETFDRLLRQHTDSETRALLSRTRRRAATARAQAAREARIDDPDLGARRSLLRVLRAGLRALPWAQLQPEHWREAVVVSLARVARAGENARRSGEDEDWHGWRRRARRLSQQQRALKTAKLGRDAPKFDKHQIERLGEAQDLNLLLDHCGKRSPFGKQDRTALRRFAQAELEGARVRIAEGGGAGAD
ncbi:MAG: CHAD domain-containing protein [Lysobacter sp.]|nr:CHAD domain-containing protein [Lysobacter sp.]